jgi:2-furoyl-CoA dehydrogenase large subunit
MAMTMIGSRVKRREDARLVVGQGQYIGDLSLPGMVHAALLRSPYAHARIKGIDATEALKLPGVLAVVTGAELKENIRPMTSHVDTLGKVAPTKAHDYPMAVAKARYVGEPVAAVVATSRYIAEDALELINVDYEPLPAVTDAEEALAPGAPRLFDEMESNVYWHGSFEWGDLDKAFAEADRVLSRKFYFHRFSSTPLETNGIVASYNKHENSLTIWGNFQSLLMFQRSLVASFGIPANKIRLITPSDVGGGFGIKQGLQPFATLVSYLSKRVDRPVKWIEDRMEHMLGGHHGTERTLYVDFAIKNDGTILGYRARTYDNEGAYVHLPEPLGAVVWAHCPQGCYHIRNIAMDCYSVLTNKCPVTPNRGYGRMQHQFMLERMMDFVAKELGMAPHEVRMKNFIRAEEFPYECTNGSLYDSGDYHECMRRALALLDYDYWKKEQAKARKEGRYIGVGIVSIMDPGATNFAVVGLLDNDSRMSVDGEAATVKLDPAGNARVITGSWGQGHETICAQIVADEFGIPFENIYVLPGVDTDTHPLSGTSGTYASRFAAMVSGALQGACGELKAKMIRIAAHLWRTDPENLEFSQGRVVVRGNPQQGMPMQQLTAIALFNPALLPAGMGPGMEATCIYNFPRANPRDDKHRANYAATYANVVHAAAIEIDPLSGFYKVLKYVVVHDAGTLINPMIVDGQVHGATAHSLGSAMLEEFVYDEEGQLLTGTFNEYLCPKATDIPNIDIEHHCSPSPFTAYGVKGMGEGGGPVPALIAQAIEDALGDPGLEITSSFNPPEKVFWLMKERGLTVS